MEAWAGNARICRRLYWRRPGTPDVLSLRMCKPTVQVNAVTQLASYCLVRQRSDMSGRLGASCAALLTFLLVLCTINGVTSQATDCSELPTNSELENLIALVFKESDAAADHIINVMEVNYVCLVSGAFRGTYRGVSAVIRYECQGVRCPQSNVSQFEFSCVSGVWDDSVLGSPENLITAVADAALSSPTRTGCSRCFGPAHITLMDNPELLPLYDSFNHCLRTLQFLFDIIYNVMDIHLARCSYVRAGC